jgi:histone deacetylase 8
MYLDLDLHFSDAVSQAFYRPGSTTAAQVLVRVSRVIDDL